MKAAGNTVMGLGVYQQWTYIKYGSHFLMETFLQPIETTFANLNVCIQDVSLSLKQYSKTPGSSSCSASTLS